MKDLLIIDADGHLNEPFDELRSRMPERYRDFQPGEVAGSHHWDRYLGGTLGKMHGCDPRVQLQDMDTEGIDVQVIFPSGLSLSSWKNAGAATEHARVYNEWLAEFCSADVKRLKGVAQVALQDVNGAIKEVRRAVELGHVAVMMPTNVLDQDIGERQFWPFYEEVQGLGVALAVHGGINSSERMFGRFNSSFIHVHTVSFPFECMTAVTGLIYAGVPETFPTMKIAILEGCIGWVPFLMDRMDEEFELRGRVEAPLLKRKPSEYMASGQFWYGLEIEESSIPFVIQRIGADKLLYASDYPHWDSSWPDTVKAFLGRDDISDAHKREILGENPQRLYGFAAEVATPVAA